MRLSGLTAITIAVAIAFIGIIAFKYEGLVYRAIVMSEKMHLDGYVKQFIRHEKPYDAHHVETTLFNGMPILLNADDTCVCRSIRLFGRYEKAETKATLSLIREGDVIVEAGANYGYYTLLMAQKVGSTGKIYSFEANPDVYPYLVASVERNNLANVRSFNIALADHGYTSYLAYGHENVGAGYILNEEQAKASTLRTEYDIIRPITVSTIDRELSGVVADVIRMDVEGAEYLILKGARQLLTRSPGVKIILEWAPRCMERLGISVDEAIEFLRQQGYLCWLISERGALVKTELAALKDIDFCNIVLCVKDITPQHRGLF